MNVSAHIATPTGTISLRGMKEEQNGTMEIVFGTNSSDKKYRIFEISQPLLVEMEKGYRIVGDDSSEAVLCTSSKTYSIKKVETSNSIYLVPPSAESNIFSVMAPQQEYYEVTPTYPRIEKLKSLLALSSYSGKQNDEKMVGKLTLITRSSLAEIIQASDEEINVALNSLETIEIDGFLRLVDKTALREITANLLDTIMENQWSLDHITIQMCLNAMDDSIDEHLLQFALNNLSKTRSSNPEGIWQLDYNLISRNVAKKLFQQRLSTTRERTWPVEDFLLTWSVNVPSVGGQHPSLDCLSGIAIRLSDTKRGKKTPVDTFFYLDLEDLSSSAKIRFQQLFEYRPSYSLEEIEPYLKDLYGHTSQPTTIHELLLQYTLLRDGSYLLKIE